VRRQEREVVGAAEECGDVAQESHHQVKLKEVGEL
jgi:hypothetical protein